VALPQEYLGIGKKIFEKKLNKQEGFELLPTTGIAKIWKNEQMIDVKVYKVDVKCLRFNHGNGRLEPFIKSYIAKNNHPKDFFETNDMEDWEKQKILYDLLKNNPQRDETYQKFAKGEKPDKSLPIISTPGGRVINGNQRLSVFKELHSSDPNKFHYLGHMYVGILPSYGSAEDEEALENKEQMDQLVASQFDWIQNSLRYRRKASNGWMPEKIAAYYNQKISTVKRDKQSLDIADEYLKFRGEPGDYSRLYNKNFKGEQIITGLHSLCHNAKNIKNEKQRLLLKRLAFNLIDNDLAGTSMSGWNTLGKLCPLIQEINNEPWMQKQYNVSYDGKKWVDYDSNIIETSTVPKTTSPLFEPIKKVKIKKKESTKDPIQIKLESLESVEGSEGNIGKTIVNITKIITEDKKENEKMKKEKDFSKKGLNEIDSKLEKIIKNLVLPEVNITGFSEMLEKIDKKIDTVKQIIAKHGEL